jgi:hypothetical protein
MEVALKPLIMLSGKLKSGKTTLAEDLALLLSIPRDSFARPLKEGLKTMGIIVDGPDKDRDALQQIGADYFRRRDPNWWVKLLSRNNVEMHKTGLVIDDCRFLNEYDFGEKNDFLMIRVKISPETQQKRGASPSTLEHISETALDFLPDEVFDLVLEENTSVPERIWLIFEAAAKKFPGVINAKDIWQTS